jgi:flagellar biosynthesis/type III secretory pathway M-ring protein FliF/YscJ
MAEEEIFENENPNSGFAPDNQRLPKTQTNRQFIIGGLIIAVVIVGALITFFGSDSSPSEEANKNANKSIMVSKGSIEKERVNRKKIKYVKLFSQLDAGDSSKILKELSLEEVRFTTEQNGQKFTILVDENQLDKARNLLAIKGIPSGKSKKGYELLDDAQTLGVTEFDKRIRFLRALSGELEKAIAQLDIIESSKVQIVLPEQRLFAVTQPPVTSSIVVRVIEGGLITDEIVFSIIQLVSNAVENLQPENVSVIDTEGNLLSDGLFERIAAKRAGTYVEEENNEPVLAAISREEAIGSPIIPNYDRIQEWFEIKWNFENNLKQKIEKQLLGIMPIASFKVEVTSDLGPLENGNIVDIKRQTVSIVIDGLNEEVFVDQAFKQQVFQTIAGSMGYIRGRDSIQLSIAEFPLYTESEKKALIAKYTRQGLYNTILLWAGGGIGLVFLFYALRFVFRRRTPVAPVVSDVNENEFSMDDDVIENESEFDNNFKINQVRQISLSTPELLAQIIEKWLKEDDDISGAEVEGEELVLDEVES